MGMVPADKQVMIKLQGWIGWGTTYRFTKFGHSVPERYFYVRIPFPIKRYSIHHDDMVSYPWYWLIRYKAMLATYFHNGP